MNWLALNETFKALTGHTPFPWQRRLFDQFQSGRLPSAVDIPTGLGKTAVMAIWLLARSEGAPLPRRLVYIVDRRAVVDQATDFALRLRKALSAKESLGHVRRRLDLVERSLPISTLRGQHTDNREWLDDPTAPVIIVATVDMIGSRLLFEGYGVSRRMRPYHAGLLGCDSLVLLDEAHLSRPFEELLRRIEFEQRPTSDADHESEPGTPRRSITERLIPPPFRVLPLSATLGSSPRPQAPFTIDHEDWTNETARTRIKAHKVLQVNELETGSRLDGALASHAWDLAKQEEQRATSPMRTLVYCDSRKVAEGVRDRLLNREKLEKTGANVILFVGGRRVHEREAAANELRKHGLLADCDGPPDTPVFLVATSAGEVGVDLDADHMVCDLVAWERMVQRLGRVNRRGLRSARIQVLDHGPPTDEGGRERHLAVRTLLHELPSCDEGHLAGPAAIIGIGERPGHSDLIMRASTPMPLFPALTRPLIDAWAMTSLREHTGRPEVEPWLRGWVKQDPQSTVVWRRFLPVRTEVVGGSDFAIRIQNRIVEEFFEASSLKISEQLQTETPRVVDWLRARARRLTKDLDKSSGEERNSGAAPIASSANPSHSSGADVVAPLQPDAPIAFVLSGGGEFERVLRLSDAGTKLKAKEMVRQLAGKLIVVDARLCGLTDGLLDARSGEPVPTAEDNWGDPDASRVEFDGETTATRGPLMVRVRLLSDNERQRGLTERECDRGFDGQLSVARHEVWSAPYRVAGEDSVINWLVIERWTTEASDEDSWAVSPALQELEAHHERAAMEAQRIATNLGLPPAYQAMLVAAARHHDGGKRALRWQRAFNAPHTGGPFAKTPGPLNRHALNGFRHEFQSVIDAENGAFDGLDKSDHRFDLGLHLIAAHHGNARPLMGIQGCDELPPTAAARRALKIAQRFARLQRRWGPWGLAWWEALLRAADQRASKAPAETNQSEQGEPSENPSALGSQGFKSTKSTSARVEG